jgi:phosphomannomutase
MKFENYLVNESIFKSYDIRGVFGEEWNASTAYAIAQAFLKVNPAKTIAVGYDHRASTPELRNAFIAGLTDAGVTVWDIGQLTTDAVYFSSWNYKDEIDGAVMITASHLPAHYNGIKFITNELKPIGRGSGMEELFEYVSTFASNPADEMVLSETKGVVVKKEIVADYIPWLLSHIDASKIKPLKVVMDCGNGVAGPIAKKVFESLGLEITELFFEPDASFPNHEANPIIEENRIDIMRKVKELGADLGIAWDADADRAYFIDENGEFIHGDFLTALLTIQVLKANPGSNIVYDLRASNVVADTVKAHGGVAHMQRVGHAHIKKMMRDVDAVFAGEVSGHYYFKDNAYMDNGFLPPLMILELLSESNKTLSEFIADLGDYYVSGEINSEVAQQDTVFARLKEKYSDAALLELDGVSFTFDDWRFNVRASNTEPLIRLNLEANSTELMETKRDEVLALIRQ